MRLHPTSLQFLLATLSLCLLLVASFLILTTSADSSVRRCVPSDCRCSATPSPWSVSSSMLKNSHVMPLRVSEEREDRRFLHCHGAWSYSMSQLRCKRQTCTNSWWWSSMRASETVLSCTMLHRSTHKVCSTVIHKAKNFSSHTIDTSYLWAHAKRG